MRFQHVFLPEVCVEVYEVYLGAKGKPSDIIFDCVKRAILRTHAPSKIAEIDRMRRWTIVLVMLDDSTLNWPRKVFLSLRAFSFVHQESELDTTVISIDLCVVCMPKVQISTRSLGTHQLKQKHTFQVYLAVRG